MNGVVTSFAEQNVTIESLSASVTQSTLMSAVGSESALKETQSNSRGANLLQYNKIQ